MYQIADKAFELNEAVACWSCKFAAKLLCTKFDVRAVEAQVQGPSTQRPKHCALLAVQGLTGGIQLLHALRLPAADPLVGKSILWLLLWAGGAE